MAKKWKDESAEYRQRLLEKYRFNEDIEDFNIDDFKRNPKKFFEQTGWTIPQEHFEEIVEALSDIANSDSDISLEGMDLGSKGEYIQSIVQKLMQTDKNFANTIGQVSKEVEGKMSEGKGKGRKILMASLLCLSVLAGAVSCATSPMGLSYETISPTTMEEVEYNRSSSQGQTEHKGTIISTLRVNNTTKGRPHITIKEGKKRIFNTWFFENSTKSVGVSSFLTNGEHLYTNTIYTIEIENQVVYRGTIDPKKTIVIYSYKDKSYPLDKYGITFK